MLVIGLTGGIGTGKSEAARHLKGLGATVIEADAVGHEVYKPNTECWREVVAAFGEDVLRPNGEIDRRKLGGIVFSSPEQLARLNGIVHPGIARMVTDELDRLRAERTQVAVLEAALLFEAGWDSLVDEVWVTDSPVEDVVRRLQVRSGLSPREVVERIGAQMARSERLARADVVIDNASGVDELKRAVDNLWNSRVKERAAEE